MDNELHRVVSKKEWLISEVNNTLSELKYYRLQLIKHSALVILGSFGAFMSTSYFISSNGAIPKFISLNIGLLSFVLVKYQVYDLDDIFDGIDINNEYLSDYMDKLDEEDIDIIKIKTRSR